MPHRLQIERMQRVKKIQDYIEILRTRNPERTITPSMTREARKYAMAFFGATRTRAKEYVESALFLIKQER